MKHDIPAYLKTGLSALAARAQTARDLQRACTLCGHRCLADRSRHPGLCRIQQRAWVASYGPHHGEEDPLRGTSGSGTIFFSSCNLQCLYCQNADISQSLTGKEVDTSGLASIMLMLQEQGCHNINLVSPSHVVAEILEALVIAAQNGLCLPLVWNTGGYDSIEALRLLDEVVDIYMPDMKYADADIALQYSGIRDYPDINQQAVREMHRQVGDLEIIGDGTAVRGLLVRHLILPDNLSGTDVIIHFLAGEISTNTYFNLMDQYRPCHLANQHPPLDRPITREEYAHWVREARAAGLNRLDERHRFSLH